jgi:hypothetical protein
VSPQWRDEATALVSPRGAALRFVRRSLRPAPRVTAHRRAELDGAEPWSASVAALAEGLGSMPRATRCRVVVSSSFARYALLPFSPTLIDRGADEALAAHVFRHIYGEQADKWSCRVSPAAAGRKRLACAFDTALIGALESAARGSGAALVAIEPAFVAAFNLARRDLPASCWFAALEADRLVLGLLIGGQWVHIAAERRADWSDAILARALARESLLVSPDLPHRDLPCWIARFDDSASIALERFDARPSGKPAAAGVAAEKRA